MDKRSIKFLAGNIYMRILGVLNKKCEKAIFFDNSVRSTYRDNTKYISEKMHELYPEYRLIWYIREMPDTPLPDYIEVVSGQSERLRAMAACFCLVRTNAFWQRAKKPGQFFIQTWHGDRSIKKIEFAQWDDVVYNRDEYVTDLFVTGSRHGTKYIARDSFRYHGEILQEGMPRNDRLVGYDPAEALRIRERLGIDPDTGILLYAPTWRDIERGEKQRLRVDVRALLRVLTERDGGREWICLMRAHPSQCGMEQGEADGDSYRIRDMSTYPDVTDLLMITDMLISDYSSIAGDYVLLRRPIILAIFDEADYTSRSRELIEPMEDTGFLLAHDEEELEHMVATLSKEEYLSSAERVYEHYGITESGHSAEIICGRIDRFYKEHWE